MSNSIIVEFYTTWMLARRVVLTMPDGRTYNITIDEASTLIDDLSAALGDAEREPNDEMVCPAGTHGSGNSRCTCEDSEDA